MAWIIILASALLLFLWLRGLTRAGNSSSMKMPPGPAGWPYFGHLLHLGSAQTSLPVLENKYGSMFTLWLGRVPTVAISGAVETRQALLECGAALASRPRLRSRAILTGNYCIMNTSPYGPYWRALRRGLVSIVIGPSNLKRLSPVRKGIFDAFIAWLKEEASQNEGVVPFSGPSRLAIFKILAYMCVGRHLDDKTLNELDEIAKHTLILQGLLKGDFVPVLGLFESKQVKMRQEFKRRQEALWGPLVAENQKLISKHKPTSSPDDEDVRLGCYMHTLLTMDFDADTLPRLQASTKSSGLQESPSKLQAYEIAALCTEFMNAGTDTTAACVEWAMANLIHRQDIQDRVHQEIYNLVGDRTLCETDLASLPYLRAVIKETLRRHPSAHFTFTHAPTNGPCKVGGFDIPENALVSFHLASILRDPTVWEEPMEFRPERFLDVEIDVTGWKKTNAIPFGAGRRICPGANLALLHANLLVGRLVQSLEWSPSANGTPMDLGERTAGVVAMKNPLSARIKERTPPFSFS